MMVVMAMTATCDGWVQTAGEQLQPLVETSALRSNLAQKVAFAKWDNGTAVEDPPREEHVIASAVREGKTEGLDPAVVSRFFRAQNNLSIRNRSLLNFLEVHVLNLT